MDGSLLYSGNSTNMKSTKIADSSGMLWSDNRNVSIEATPDGILIRSIDPYHFAPVRPFDWRRIKSPLSIRNFGLDVASLLQNEFIQARGEDVFVPAPNIYKLLSEEIGLFLRVIRLAPLSLDVRSTGTPGREDFGFRHSWYNGTQEVYPTVFGCFMSFRDRVYLLEKGQFDTLQTLSSINSLRPEERSREVVFRAIAQLHRNQQAADIRLESFLAETVVIEPSKVGVGIHRDKGESLSLYPVFKDVEPTAMRDAFMQQGKVDGVYDLPRREGGRVRVLLSDDIQEVLKDLRKARRLSGAKAKRIEEAPGAVLRDGINRGVLDDSFSPRVIGLTDVLVSKISRQQSESRGWIGEEEGRGPQSDYSEEGDRLDGDEVAGAGPEDYGLDDTLERYKPTYRRLAILTNQEAVDFKEGKEGEDARDSEFPPPSLPSSLVSHRVDSNGQRRPFSLKRHQLLGISWLQQLYMSRETHKGCLLADDMGLGKTLQLLSFLASVVEGKVGPAWPEKGPYNPILVIAPLILFQSWKQEILSSFSPSPFGHVLTLHGAELQSLRNPDSGTGHELKLEESVLNLDMIRQHRLVVTNYDTARNFQHSLGKIQWSVVVADEVQEIKSESVTSEATKALKSYFRIASTGTPVENRLLDLWNIVDFLQPGTLLGAANDFKREYETPMAAEDATARNETADKLRQVLGYNRPFGRILRRDKRSELPDLPKKEIRKIECDLSLEEIELYDDLRRRAALMTQRGRKLGLISNDLKSLFNHPRLYTKQQDLSDAQALIAESPKIQALVDVLKDIRRLGQKVLIFSDRHAMQTILAEVINHVFSFRPTIINSMTGTGSLKSEKSRVDLIKQFERKEGFNAIILSPMCAGVGLTITGANHVIHYGRWWNPAVENQATDRAYRIGQNLPVFVYHLIARDKTGRVPRSFDQILEELLVSKEALAADFLSGSAQCQLADEDVLAAVLRDPAPTTSTGSVCREARDIENLDPHVFEELCGICLERQGFSTLASPRTNDGGIDIFAWNHDELRLVQCKHKSQANKLVLSDSVEQLLGGQQTYQREINKVKGRRLILLSVMTNGNISLRDRLRGRPHDVHVSRRNEIWEQLKRGAVTHADLCEYRGRRCASRKELLERLSTIV